MARGYGASHGDSGSPYAVLDRTLATCREASRIRELPPIVERKSIAQPSQRIRDGEAVSVEVVSSPSAVEAGETHPEHRPDRQLITQVDQTEIYLASTEVPFVLCITGDTVAIDVSNGRQPHALVISTSADLKQWAERTFESYRDRAQSLQE